MNGWTTATFGGLLTIKLALAILLAVSSFMHIGNMFLFLSSVIDYNILLPGAAIYMASVLPFLQLTVAIALIAQVKSLDRDGLAWSALLFAVFTFSQGIAMQRKLDISCGCFGMASETISWKTLGLSIGGLVLSLGGWMLSKYLRKMSMSQQSSPSSPLI